MEEKGVKNNLCDAGVRVRVCVCACVCYKVSLFRNFTRYCFVKELNFRKNFNISIVSDAMKTQFGTLFVGKL